MIILSVQIGDNDPIYRIYPETEAGNAALLRDLKKLRGARTREHYYHNLKLSNDVENTLKEKILAFDGLDSNYCFEILDKLKKTLQEFKQTHRAFDKPGTIKINIQHWQ